MNKIATIKALRDWAQVHPDIFAKPIDTPFGEKTTVLGLKNSKDIVNFVLKSMFGK